MADQNNKKVDALAQEITLKSRGQGKLRQFILWMGALIIGAILGWHIFQFLMIYLISLLQYLRIYSNSLQYLLYH